MNDIDAGLLEIVEARGLRAMGQTLAEIAARAKLPQNVCALAVQELVAQGRASASCLRGRGLKREPTFKRGRSGLDLLRSAAVRPAGAS